MTDKTIQHYGYTQRYFRDFLTSDIDINEISEKHGVDFLEFLKTKNLGQNYIAVIFGRIQNCLTWCVKKGYIDRNVLLGVYVKRNNTPKPKTTISPEQMDFLKTIKLEDVTEQLILDVFLFQCETGLDYGDVVIFLQNPKEYIKEQNGQKYIELARQKRKKQKRIQTLPLFNYPISILEKYNYHIDVCSNMKMNVRIKQILKNQGIEDANEITTHVGRKTFISGLVNQGVNIKLVSEMVAHSSVLITERHYAKIRTKTILEAIKDIK